MKRSIIFLFAFGFASPVFAVNLSFMPGDSFFHDLLTEELLGTASEKGIRLRYSGVPGEGGFCGYAGFIDLQITGNTTTLSRHLRTLYKSLRKYYSKELRVNDDGTMTETNGFHLFIYNADIKWSKGYASQRLGIKYNESWANLPDSAIQSKTRKLGIAHVKAHKYDTFVKVPDAIIHDWKYGKEFKELDVKVPEGIGWGITGPRIKATVSIDAAKIQIVLVPESNLKPYFQQKPKYEFYSVTNDGIRVHQFKGEDVVTKDWKPEDQ